MEPADKWSYSEEELLARRLDCNSAVRSRLLARDLQYPLSTTDERCILLYYHQKINDICKYFKFPASTVLCSHLIFSRIHINKPILDTVFDLKHVMLASVYLASKVDELHTSVVAFCGKIPGTDVKTVEELEFILLDWLDYEVAFDLPIQPLVAFVMELFGGDAAAHDTTYTGSIQSITSMFMTDIPHIFSPPVMALAALKQTLTKQSADRLHTFETYLGSFERHSGLPLKQSVEDLLTLAAAQATTLDARYLKEIDGKLNECRKSLM